MRRTNSDRQPEEYAELYLREGPWCTAYVDAGTGTVDPLAKHRPEEFPYVVAEVSREHGEIRLHYAGSGTPASTQEVQG